MGTTPNRSWPYPESSDFVADGATAIENLADAIDDSVGRGYVYVQTLKYTVSGTFTKATYPWLRAVIVKLQGGGGAGGGAAATSATQIAIGGGGGAGGYTELFIPVASLSASETVTIGAGGLGVSGANGNNGGTTLFGSHCSAQGGFPGLTSGADVPNGANGAGGSGGSASSAGLIIGGNPGLYATGLNGSIGRVLSGAGGMAHLGAGGIARYTASGFDGAPGGGPGGGGSGGCNDNNNAATRAGGTGGAGVIYVELYA